MIDLKWISKDMIPDKWYKIKDDEQLKEWKRQIYFRLGWPVFQLSLSADEKYIKKTIV